MGREINTNDSYISRLLKNIPSEIIATYLALAGLLKSKIVSINTSVLLWIIFAVLLVATPFWMIFVEKTKMYRQVVFATISFIVWVMVIGGPFETLGGYDTIIGSILLIICTAIVFPIVSKVWK